MMGPEEDDEDYHLLDLFLNRNYEKRIVSINGHDVIIHALHDAASTDFDLTGQVIWPAAWALGQFLSENPSICQGKKILELGSGTGLTGLLAAKLSDDPSKVVLSDNNDHVLELLQMNIESNFENFSPKPICSNLSWGKDNLKTFINENGEDFNMLLGADVIYWPTSVCILIETVHHFLKNSPNSFLLLGYTERSIQTTQLLFSTAKMFKLIHEELHLKDPSKYSSCVHIYKFIFDGSL